MSAVSVLGNPESPPKGSSHLGRSDGELESVAEDQPVYSERLQDAQLAPRPDDLEVALFQRPPSSGEPSTRFAFGKADKAKGQQGMAAPKAIAVANPRPINLSLDHIITEHENFSFVGGPIITKVPEAQVPPLRRSISASPAHHDAVPPAVLQASGERMSRGDSAPPARSAHYDPEENSFQERQDQIQSLPRSAHHGLEKIPSQESEYQHQTLKKPGQSKVRNRKGQHVTQNRQQPGGEIRSKLPYSLNQVMHVLHRVAQHERGEVEDAACEMAKKFQIEIDQLKAKISALVQAEGISKSNNDKLRRELKTKSQKFGQLELFMTGAARDTQSLQMEHNELKRELQALLALSQELKQAIQVERDTVKADVDAKLKEANAASQGYVKQVLEMKADLRIAMELRENFEKQLGEKVGELSEERDRCSRLEKNFQKMQEDHHIILQSDQWRSSKVGTTPNTEAMEGRLQQRLLEMKADLTSREALQGKILALECSTAILAERNHSQQQHGLNFHQEQEKLRVAEASLAGYVNVIETLKQENEELRVKVSEVEGKVMENDNTQAEFDRRILEGIKEQKEINQERTDKQIKQLKADCDNKIHQVRQAAAEEKKRFIEELAKQKCEIETKEMHHADLEVTLRTTFEEHRTTLEEQRTAYEEQYTVFEEKRNAYKEQRTIFEEKRSAFDEERAAFEAERSAIRNTRITFEEKCTALEEKRTAVEEERTALIEQRTILEENRTALVEERTALEEDRTALVEERTALEMELTAFEDKCNSFEEKRTSLEERLSQDQRRLNFLLQQFQNKHPETNVSSTQIPSTPTVSQDLTVPPSRPKASRSINRHITTSSLIYTSTQDQLDVDDDETQIASEGPISESMTIPKRTQQGLTTVPRLGEIFHRDVSQTTLQSRGSPMKASSNSANLKRHGFPNQPPAATPSKRPRFDQRKSSTLAARTDSRGSYASSSAYVPSPAKPSSQRAFHSGSRNMKTRRRNTTDKMRDMFESELSRAH